MDYSSNPNHDPRIIEQADWLATLQKDGQHVVINMKTDEDMQTASHYYGMVERVVIAAVEPYVDILAEKLVIEYFSQKHRDAHLLFDTLRAAREAAVESQSIQLALDSDMALMDAIEKELEVVHQDQTIELNGIPQRVAISGIAMTFGLGRP